MVSGNGSAENTQGARVHMPCPSNAVAISIKLTFVTWWARASATAPATALFSAVRTTWAAASVAAASVLRPVQTRLVWRPEAPASSTICAGPGMGW